MGDKPAPPVARRDWRMKTGRSPDSRLSREGTFRIAFPPGYRQWLQDSPA